MAVYRRARQQKGGRHQSPGQRGPQFSEGNGHHRLHWGSEVQERGPRWAPTPGVERCPNQRPPGAAAPTRVCPGPSGGPPEGAGLGVWGGVGHRASGRRTGEGVADLGLQELGLMHVHLLLLSLRLPLLLLLPVQLLVQQPVQGPVHGLAPHGAGGHVGGVL